jgi:hypothetical protein
MQQQQQGMLSQSKALQGDLDHDRLWLSFGLVAFGILAVAIIIGIFGGTVSGVVTAGISAISTLVGFLVGHTVGSVGKEKTAKQVDDAHQLVSDALEKLKP